MTDSYSTPKHCTQLKVRKLSRVLSRLYDAEVSQAHLRSTQFSLLTVINNRGPISPGDLADLMFLDASTVTRNLRPLLAAGLVIQSDGVDVRTKLIAVTLDGRKKQAEAQAYWTEIQTQLTKTLGIERVAALHSLIDDCLNILNSTNSVSGSSCT